jgi:carboxymethylenebutenolidase
MLKSFARLIGRRPLDFFVAALAVVLLCAPLVRRSSAQVRRPVEKQQAERQTPEQIKMVEGRSAPYTTLYYKSGGLNVEAYFYKPQGTGPFPLVIYNHGSRSGQEHVEKPFPAIAQILVPQGYAVLVPERRGYGKSDGPTYGEEVGNDRGELMMKRFSEEAGDVLAGLDYLKRGEVVANAIGGKPSNGLIDFKRVALMGWSHGGVVSLLAASERHEFVALVDQAGGALTWNSSPVLRNRLPDAAAKIKVPALCMDAENDATTNAVKSVGEAIKNSGEWERTIIYPPFTPTSNPSNIAPGHLIFGQGIPIWQNDLVAFLKPRL